MTSGTLKDVLARVQSDYEFYIRLQENPEKALAGYQLLPDDAPSSERPRC